MSAAIDWRKVPKRALIDALNNVQIGGPNKAMQDKTTLIGYARMALRSSKADIFRQELEREIAYQHSLRRWPGCEPSHESR